MDARASQCHGSNGVVKKGKFTGLSPIFNGKVTLVSGVDFPD